MYSPTQGQEYIDNNQQTGSVGTTRNNNNNRLFNPSQYHHHHHTRQNSFGTVASAISSTSSPLNIRGGGMATAAAAAAAAAAAYNNDNNQHWFGTSLDSNGSSSLFGQSPTASYNDNRDLIISPSTSSTSQLDSFNSNNNNEDDEGGQQRNLQDMFEKRRRRRESHNAVERRRRDNINERIHELCTLLPERLLDSAPTSSNVMSVSSSQVGSNGRAINKGTILKLSVDHIKELRQDVDKYQERIRELEQLIEAAKRGEMIGNSDNSRMTGGDGHQRIGSIQFRQQFNNLQID